MLEHYPYLDGIMDAMINVSSILASKPPKFIFFPHKSLCGSLFQRRGAITEKVRSPYLVIVRGPRVNCKGDDDRRGLKELEQRKEIRSERYSPPGQLPPGHFPTKVDYPI